MSVHALAWVFDLPAAAASPTERLLLLALADHANRDGEDIFPTNKRLQRMTGLSERTIRKTLRSLEEKRLLLQAGTWHPEGRQDRARPRFSMPIQERGAPDAPRQHVPPERGAGDAPEPTTGTDKPTPPPSHPKKEPPEEQIPPLVVEAEEQTTPQPVPPLQTAGKDLRRWRAGA